MASKKKEPDFEQALSELEGLVELMEDGELTLEESIKTYERGVLLGRGALKALDAAQQRVELLASAEQASSDDDADTETHE